MYKKENIKTSCRDNKSKLFCKMLILQGLTKVCALTYNYVIVKGLRGAGDRTRRGGGDKIRRGGGDRTRRGGGDRKGKERKVIGKESKLVNH